MAAVRLAVRTHLLSQGAISMRLDIDIPVRADSGNTGGEVVASITGEEIEADSTDDHADRNYNDQLDEGETLSLRHGDDPCREQYGTTKHDGCNADPSGQLVLPWLRRQP